MPTQVQRRRGTTTQHATFTGAAGELTVDTTKKTVVVHDGATAGGAPLAREDLSNVGTVPVAKGGTGATTLTSGAYLKGAGTSAVTAQTGIPADDITSGTIGTARLGSGSASASTFLRGDQTWAAVPAADTLGDTAAASLGAIGTYAFLGETTTTATAAGSTRAGSNLRYAGSYSTSSWSGTSLAQHGGVGGGGTPAGTWRAMGRCYGSTDIYGATLWLRIS